MTTFDPRRRFDDNHIINQTDRQRHFLDRPRPLDTFAQPTSHHDRNDAAGLLLGAALLGCIYIFGVVHAFVTQYLLVALKVTGTLIGIGLFVAVLNFVFKNYARTLIVLSLCVLGLFALFFSFVMALHITETTRPYAYELGELMERLYNALASVRHYTSIKNLITPHLGSSSPLLVLYALTISLVATAPFLRFRKSKWPLIASAFGLHMAVPLLLL